MTQASLVTPAPSQDELDVVFGTDRASSSAMTTTANHTMKELDDDVNLDDENKTTAAASQQPEKGTQGDWLAHLESGATVTAQDWELFGTAATDSCSRRRRCDNDDEKKEKENNRHASSLLVLGADDGKASSLLSRHGQVVRVRGMIQDMLDVEYFAPASSSNNNNNATPDLVERRPMMIQLLDTCPFTSDWFRSTVLGDDHDDHASDHHPNGGSPLNNGASSNKRMRHSSDVTMMSDNTNHNNETGINNKSNDPNDSSGDNDAVMNDAEHETGHNSHLATAANNHSKCSRSLSLLAHFYIDQYGLADAIPNIKLNDIVELVGVLDVPHNYNPSLMMMDDDDDTAALLSASQSNDSCNGLQHDAMFAEYCDDSDHPVVPLAVPRLHVLWYDATSDLDALVATTLPSTTCGGSSTATTPALSSPGNESAASLVDILSKELTVTPTVASAVYMALLSMAEREPIQSGGSADGGGSPSSSNSQRCVWQPVHNYGDDSTLGCASLNLQIAKKSVDCDVHAAVSKFQERLIRVLDHICPQVVSLTLTPDMLFSSKNSKQLHRLVPTKVQGRLTPSPLQLAKGSCLVLNISQIQNLQHYKQQQEMCASKTKKQLQQEEQTAAVILDALKTLVRAHKMPYKFDGGILIPFEADVRIIVLSSAAPSANYNNNAANGLLPCSLQVNCDDSGTFASSSGTTINEQDTANGIDLARRLEPVRKALAECRAPPSVVAMPDTTTTASSSKSKCNNNNIGLSVPFLKQVQQDFIARRVEARKQQQANGVAVLPTEVDFHRWLTLTRLCARSRRSQSAEWQDWTDALQLDEAMRKTLQQ